MLALKEKQLTIKRKDNQMKFEITSKRLKANYIIINCANDASSNLIESMRKHADHICFNSGVYGWNYDAYIFGRYALVEGYRTCKGDYKADYEQMRAFKENATKEDIEEFIQKTINNK